MNIEELLAYSLDNILNDEEQRRLEEALASSDALQELRDELFAMRDLLKGQQVETCPGFVQDVMRQLPPVETTIRQIGFQTQLLRLFPRVAAACVLLVGTAYLGISTNDPLWLSDTVVGLQDISPEDAYTYWDADSFME